MKRPGGGPFYEIRDGVRLPQIPFVSTRQQLGLGAQLATAIGQGREFEVRPPVDGDAVMLLVSAADDLGHVYEIDRHGQVVDIGVTEAIAGA